MYSDRQLHSDSVLICSIFQILNKKKNNKANSENKDETAHKEPSHLD